MAGKKKADAEDLGPESLQELDREEFDEEATVPKGGRAPEVAAIVLAAGEVREGWRRRPCPNCGVKHDVYEPDQPTPGTWVVDFTCTSCDYHNANLPVI
jgi:hypothetical protein